MSRHIQPLQITIIFLTLLALTPPNDSQAQQPEPIYQEIQRIGRGAISGAAWNPHENSFLVNSTQGAWIYADDFHDEFHIADSSLAVFNPTGEFLASVNKEKSKVSIWNLAEQKLTMTLPLDSGTQRITLATWSPDGQLLAVGGEHQVWVWNTTSQKHFQSLTTDNTISSITFSPDSKRFAIGEVTKVDIYQVEDWQVTLTLTDVGGAPQVAWNPVNHLIATLAAHTPVTGISVNSLKIWDATSGKLNLVIQTELATTLAWSPDGTMLATDSTQIQDQFYYSVEFWNPVTGELIGGLSSGIHHGTINAISWSVDGKYLLTAGKDNVVNVWNWPLDAKQNHKLLQVHMGEVTSIAWNAKSHLLANTSSDSGTRVWDIRQDEPVFTTYNSVKDVLSVTWNPDGDQIAIGDGQGDIHIGDMATQKASFLGQQNIVSSNNDQGVATIDWSPDGTLLATGGYDGTIHIWNIAKRSTKLIHQNRMSPVLSLEWSNDGKHLLSYDGAIVSWSDIQTGKSIQEYTSGRTGDAFQQSTISPNGKFVAGLGANSPLYIWDTFSGNLLNSVGVYGVRVAWNPDSSKLAVVTNGMDVTNPNQNGLAVWDKATAQLTTIATEQSDPTAVTWIAADKLVAGFADGTMSIYQTQ